MGKINLKWKWIKLILPIILLLSLGLQQSFAQRSVSGTVISGEDNEPLPGVNVLLKGTFTGTVTDISGHYQIEVPGNESILVFSSVGFVTYEVQVGNQSVIDASLRTDITALSEVVVTGYGTQEKKDITGSIGTVGTDDFEAQPVVRFDQILQGRAAGVNVTNASGAPGGDVQIRIRGANSINGSNEPLYVIDGFVGSNFRDINPSDIESIQILKDASATAIYGSRGANGVVIITTKSGTKGESRFSLTARYYTSKVLGTYDLMDAATFAETANQRADDLGTGRPFTDQEIAGFRQNGGTDWQDEIYRTAPGQEYQLHYSGGGENVDYFISGNFLDQDGIVINSYFKRYSLRSNVNADLSDKLKASLKANFIRRENNNTYGDFRNDGPIGGTLAWAPTTPARDENGMLTVDDPISSIKSNPIELAQNDRIREVNTFNTYASLNYEFIDGLTLDVAFGLSYINQQNKNFSAGSKSSNPTGGRESIERIFLQNTNTLNYTRTFNDVHALTVTGVLENQSFQTDQFGVNTSGLLYPDLQYNNITLANSSSQASYQKQTILSYIGRVNYAYMDKYLITASVRSDGSSKFRGDNRWSTFPAVALGWRISEESFMNNDFFYDLKLRGSWGETGSQAIDVYGTVTTFLTDDYNAGTSFQNGSLTSGIIIGNPGNPNLTWETTAQWNIGMDMQIFNGRLGLILDYFNKNTTDLLLSEPLPQYAGGGSIFRNLGEVSNKGFEFTLTSTVIDNGQFRWNTNLNASFLTNEVTNIGDREVIYKDGDVGAGLTNLPEMAIIPGNSLSSYWGLNYLGTWKTSDESEASVYGNVPGDSRYEDINDDGVIGGDDYKIIGQGIPKNIFGWNNTFDWKNFRLNIFFQAMTGYQKWNFAYATAILANADAREVTHKDIQDRWVAGTNEDSDIPAFSQSDVGEIQSSRFLENGDYFRLKNLSLSYNWPVSGARGINLNFMIAASNLWTLTNYKGIDPESYSTRGEQDARGADGGSYPNAKTWTFGVNCTF
jgi:TonB-linked SusC/RagA family outer membrane protein